jgi:hypothetical protein
MFAGAGMSRSRNTNERNRGLVSGFLCQSVNPGQRRLHNNEAGRQTLSTGWQPGCYNG